MCALMCVFFFLSFLLSGIPGLLAFLLIVLEWTRPSLPSPLRPICDLRVLNHFIKEAQDAEAAMVSLGGGEKKALTVWHRLTLRLFRTLQKSCREGCTLSKAVTVPQTTVDFDVWEKKNVRIKRRFLGFHSPLVCVRHSLLLLALARH